MDKKNKLSSADVEKVTGGIVVANPDKPFGRCGRCGKDIYMQDKYGYHDYNGCTTLLCEDCLKALQ